MFQNGIICTLRRPNFLDSSSDLAFTFQVTRNNSDVNWNSYRTFLLLEEESPPEQLLKTTLQSNIINI